MTFVFCVCYLLSAKLSVSYAFSNTKENKMSDNSLEKKSSEGTILGFLSLFAWIIPLIGIPVSVMGVNASNKNNDTLGLVLSIFGGILSAANAFVGAAMNM